MMFWLTLYVLIGLWTALVAAILYFAKHEVGSAREEGIAIAWLTYVTFLWPIMWVTVTGWVLGGMLAPKPRRPR